MKYNRKVSDRIYGVTSILILEHLELAADVVPSSISLPAAGGFTETGSPPVLENLRNWSTPP